MKKINSVRFENLELFLKDQLDEIKNIRTPRFFTGEDRRIEGPRNRVTPRKDTGIRQGPRGGNVPEKRIFRLDQQGVILNIYNMSVLHGHRQSGDSGLLLLKREN